MCWAFALREWITSPRALRDLLMCRASCRRAPSEPDLANLSLPARSMRFSLPGGKNSHASLNKYRYGQSVTEKQIGLSKDNVLHICGLEMAPDTTEVHKTIILLCWQISASKLSCYVQTKVQSLSYWENHNRKLESVCPRYKWPGTCTDCSCTESGCSMSRFSNFKVVLNGKATTKLLLIEGTQCK